MDGIDVLDGLRIQSSAWAAKAVQEIERLRKFQEAAVEVLEPKQLLRIYQQMARAADKGEVRDG